jgi:4-hydroxy-tetrahydrodipicolinate reductase
MNRQDIHIPEVSLSTPQAEQIGGATRVIVHGATGRMGARLRELGALDAAISIVGAADERDTDAAQRPGPTPVKAHEIRVSADVVIDFSSDHGAAAAIELADRAGAALLVGTTGLSSGTLDALRAASSRRAVLVAPNTSLGVAVLARLAADAARALGPGYDISIVEAHHNRKKDAPSGTALRLAAAMRDAGATLPDEQVIAMRGGDVIGEHTIRLAGAGEYIELTHRATSRDLFVLGALRAAKWLRGRSAGWWTMEDALGLSRR